MIKRNVAELKQGIPTRKTGEALNEGLQPVEDARHRLKGPFQYEWWYFDASFDNGYSAVCILWPMNYFRPWKRQCSIMLSIYSPNGEHFKHYIFPPRDLFSASYQECDVRIGGSFVRGTHPRYEVHVEAEGDIADLVFEAQTPGWKPGTAVNQLPYRHYNTMGWLVPVPAAKVHGKLVVQGHAVEVEGHGYHDHNWGEAPIAKLTDNWHWGHIVSGDLGIIWSDITASRKLKYDKSYMFLLSKGHRLVYESAHLDIAYDDWKKDPAYLLPYPRRISISFGSQEEGCSGQITMDVLEVVETEDQLEVTGIPQFMRSFIRSRLANPYYFRWRSEISGWVEIEGKKISVEGETIHEQMILRGMKPPA
jgi:Svf1-like C-terminal lipocalin-like domain